MKKQNKTKQKQKQNKHKQVAVDLPELFTSSLFIKLRRQ